MLIPDWALTVYQVAKQPCAKRGWALARGWAFTREFTVFLPFSLARLLLTEKCRKGINPPAAVAIARANTQRQD